MPDDVPDGIESMTFNTRIFDDKTSSSGIAIGPPPMVPAIFCIPFHHTHAPSSEKTCKWRLRIFAPAMDRRIHIALPGSPASIHVPTPRSSRLPKPPGPVAQPLSSKVAEE